MKETPVLHGRHSRKMHACYVDPPGIGNEAAQFVHPRLAFRGDRTVIEDISISRPREGAKQLSAQYDEQVLGLSPGRDQAIVVADKNLSYLRYPATCERNTEVFDGVSGRAPAGTGLLLGVLLALPFWATIAVILWRCGVIR